MALLKTIFIIWGCEIGLRQFEQHIRCIQFGDVSDTSEIPGSFTDWNNNNGKTVSDIFVNIKSKTSFGWDGISTKLLNNLQDILLKPLTLIIKHMLSTGIFPDQLKIARVCPMYKKDDD